MLILRWVVSGLLIRGILKNWRGLLMIGLLIVAGFIFYRLYGERFGLTVYVSRFKEAFLFVWNGAKDLWRHFIPALILKK